MFRMIARVSLLALLSTAVIASTAPGASGAQLEREALLTPMSAPVPARLTSFAGPETRHGVVEVRPEMLASGAPGETSRLLLSPFEGALLELELESAVDPNEGEIWVGRVVGQPASRAHLRRVGGSLAGSLRTRDGILQILPDGAGRAVVLQATEPPLPDFVLPAPEEFRETAPPAARAAALDEDVDETSRIDLMVVVERQVYQEINGLGAWLKTTIRNGIVDLNLALADSGVNAEFNLQKIKRDRYPDTGDDRDYASALLNDATDPNDNRMKKTQRLRRKFGSDIVAIVMSRNTGVCGLGWLTGDRGDGVQPEDAGLAFSVTSWRCLVTGTLPHEIGHNMGGQHSHLDPTSDFLGAYDYSYGHKSGLDFYTIMAYSCEFCTAALLFSTPDVLVDGDPAGVRRGNRAANNALGFEQDRETLASFRECRRACK